MEPKSQTENVKAEQAAIWLKWSETLRDNPTSENYARAYDEINEFLRSKGDPALARPADQTIYGASGAMLDWEKRIIARLAGRAGNNVFEVGCGDGRLALELARRGATVKGIDISLVAVETARELAEKEGLALSFATGSAFNLTEPAASFDCVVSADMAEHLHPSHIPKHLAEVWRVLKPGGAYILTLPRWEPPDRIDPLHLGNYHPHEFAAMLRDAGFEPESAAERLYKETRDLAAIFGAPHTARARAARLAAHLPLIGGTIARFTIRRWCRSLNFYYAAKPPAQL